MAKEIKTLSGDKAIEKWLEGCDKWNKWVSEHPEYNVDFTGVDFSKHRGCENISEHKWPFAEFRFPNGKVSFVGATFGEGHVNFIHATFGGKVIFIRTTLGKGNYNFKKVDFMDRTIFHELQNASVIKSFTFQFATFEKSLEISADDSFNCVVDLTGTSLSNQVVLENLSCNINTALTEFSRRQYCSMIAVSTACSRSFASSAHSSV